MTGRTHDLAAFTAMLYCAATLPLPQMSLATVITCFGVNMLGGLAPDIDQPTSSLWQRVRAGSILGRLVHPLFGGHRYISHSLVGIFLFGYITHLFGKALGTVLLVDMNLVWWSFMIGYVSHLITDSFTRDGVPWLFPIPINIGIPPLRFLRFKTGGVVEKSFVFPMLLFINGYIIYAHYDTLIHIIKTQIIR